MALTADILESWRAPRRVVRRHLARGRSEPFLFTLLVTFLILAVIAVAPWLSQQAALEGTPVAPRILGACYGALLSIPVFYLFAALGHLTARLMGGKGGFYEGRLALFWALLTISPALLLYGLVRGMANGSPATPFLGLLVFVLFLGFYSVMLREAET
jgi:hypothetical protein